MVVNAMILFLLSEFEPKKLPLWSQKLVQLVSPCGVCPRFALLAPPCQSINQSIVFQRGLSNKLLLQGPKS